MFEPAALLNEAHEGGDASARADHDHRVRGLEGQAELRLADVHGHRGLVSVVGGHLVLQPVSGDSFVDPACLGLVLHHYSTDVDAVGMNLSPAENTSMHNRFISAFFPFNRSYLHSLYGVGLK